MQLCELAPDGTVGFGDMNSRAVKDLYGGQTGIHRQSVILLSLHRSSSVGFTLAAAGHMGQMLGLAQRCCVWWVVNCVLCTLCILCAVYCVLCTLFVFCAPV